MWAVTINCEFSLPHLKATGDILVYMYTYVFLSYCAWIRYDTILHVLFTYLYTDGQQSRGTVV